MEYKLVLLCVLVSLVVQGLVGVLGCTDWPPHIRDTKHNETDEQKVYYSEYVVFGMAGKTEKEPYPYAKVPGVKTISFEVKCVYKTNATDGPVPEVIKVTAVGNRESAHIPGCPPAPLKVGQTAILFLRKMRGPNTPADLFEVEFKPISDVNVDDSQKVDDLTVICGLTLTYPTEELDEICYEPLEDGDCSQYVTKTPKPYVPPVTTPMTPGKPPKEEPEPESESEEEEPNAEGEGDNVGKPIKPSKDNTYATDSDKSSGTKAEGSSDGSNGSASLQILSQSLVVLISVLVMLV